MKKLVLKTALITLCSAVLAGALVIMILCFAAPRAMMEFTASLGMESLSGNFAYSEYGRSGDLTCLARSYLIALEEGDDAKALERWEKLYADRDAFSAYCRDGKPETDELPAYSYRDYLTGSAARMKYRLAGDGAEKAEVLDFAFSETEKSFPEGNPVVALSAEAISRQDKAFAGEIYSRLNASDFEQNQDFMRLKEALENAVS